MHHESFESELLTGLGSVLVNLLNGVLIIVRNQIETVCMTSLTVPLNSWSKCQKYKIGFAYSERL